jgi:WD40 repeat protein/type II secretory pathway predicted ATPase ExeA
MPSNGYVFVTYSRTDTAVVNRLVADLREQGIEAWIDRFDLELGTPDWEEAIRTAIRGARAVLLIATPASRRSRYVKDELGIASMYRRAIYPVWAEGDEWMESVPLGLGSFQAIDARSDAYNEALKQLSTALKGLFEPMPQAAGQQAREDAAAFTPRNPYKGLDPFTSQDERDYFGREAVIEEMVTRIHRARDTNERMVAIVGASGSGKSSLVMAGLLPRLTATATGTLVLPRVLPGERPLESLATALTHMLPRRSIVELHKDLQMVDEDARALHLMTQQSGKRTLLFVDQFEELFTLTRREDERRKFIDLITVAASEPRGLLSVILTMRADFYDRPLVYTELGKLIEGSTYLLLPMTTDETQAAIERPAALPDVRVEFESNLVGDLLFEVRNQPGALPLLQFTLDQLFQRREGRLLTQNAYRAIGGVLGALAQHAEQTYSQMKADEQTVARQLFLRLVSLGEAGEDTRRRVPLEELLTLTQDDGLVRRVIERFNQARLITADRHTGADGKATSTVEISHEALISEWERLTDWLSSSREDVREQRRLNTGAREWYANNRHPSYLASGGRLERFEAWAMTTDLALSQEERIYLEESLEERRRQSEAEQRRAEREQRNAQRARLFTRAAAILGLIVFIAAGILALTYSALSTALVEVASANEQIEEARATLTTVPQTLTPAQQNVAQASTQISSANATLSVVEQRVQDSVQLAESLRLSAIGNGILQANGDAQLAALLGIRALRSAYSNPADDVLIRALPAMDSGIVLGGDVSGVWTLAMSNDETRLAVASTDGKVSIRLIDTWEPILSVSAHSDRTCAVAFSPDDRLLLTSSFDSTIKMWDAETGELLRTLEGHEDAVCSVEFSRDGSRIISTGADNTVRIWDANSGSELLHVQAHDDSIFTASFAPDASRFATGSVDTTARIWDTETGELLHDLVGHGDTVFTLTFSPDGSRLFTGSSDRIGRVWDVETGELLQEMRGHEGEVATAAFSSDGTQILTGSGDRTARLWDVATGSELSVFAGHGESIFFVTWSSTPDVIYTASIDGTLRQWNLGDRFAGIFRRHTDQVYAADFSPDATMVLSGGNDFIARLWSIETGQVLRGFVGHTDSIASLAFTHDGSRVVTGSTDSTVRVWDIASSSELLRLTGHDAEVYAVLISPDDRRVYSAGVDQQIRMWNLETGEQIASVEAHSRAIFALQMSRDGRYLISIGDDQYSRIWDANTLEMISEQRHPVRIYSGDFSPDASRYVVGGADGRVRMFDTQSDSLLGTFEGHVSAVNALQFSPAGDLLVTGGADYTVRLWDVATQRQLRRFAGHTLHIHSVAFAPRGDLVVSTSWDQTVQVHDVDYRSLIARVCDRITRDLTAAERVQYAIAESDATCPQLGPVADQILPTPTAMADLVLPVWTPFPTPTPHAGLLSAVDILQVPIQADITIDGDLTDWAGATFIDVTSGTEFSDDPAENGSFRFAVAADENYLYVTMTTPDRTIISGQHGDNFWNEDSFEFYVNLSSDLEALSYRDGIYQVNINALNLDALEPVMSTVSGLDTEAVPVQAITFRTADGWGFEAAFPFGDFTPRVGAEIGFQAQLNGTSEGDRSVKLIWSSLDRNDTSWDDPSVFGRIAFVEPVR